MRTYRLYQVDAFTREKLSGNPAGVVPDAGGLTDEEMQRIARELNNSETAFVFPSDSPEYDVQVRFFTPAREVPVCGHATVAAHYVLAKERSLQNARLRQKTGAGILPVEILSDGDDLMIVMTQGAAEFGSFLKGRDRAALLEALGLSESSLREGWPLQIVSTGHSKVMVPINSRETLDALNPDSGALVRLSKMIQCSGHYVFTADWADSIYPVHGRMFAPAAGVSEDPVTGNANGPLGAYLVHHRLVKHDGRSFACTARQGEAMGRPGTVRVEISIKGSEPTAVKISGSAVIVFKTEIAL
jgi:PhzF family phenazine biosynthesis protein